LAECLDDIAELTSYGVEIRYPGDIPEVNREDAEEALQLAEKVREAIQGALDKTD
jgi:HEPN domain-containing protein